MKKLYMIFIILALAGCDSPPTDCTTTTAAKYLMSNLRGGNILDMQNPHSVKFYEKMIRKVEYTGFIATYYGTPICRMYYGYTGYSEDDATCYIYVPQTGLYDLFFPCPKK